MDGSGMVLTPERSADALSAQRRDLSVPARREGSRQCLFLMGAIIKPPTGIVKGEVCTFLTRLEKSKLTTRWHSSGQLI